MFAAILLKILLAFGIGAIMALVVKGLVLTLTRFIKRIKDRLRAKVGSTVLISSVKPTAEKMIKEAKQSGNTKDIAELEAMAKKGGVMTATADKNGKVNPDDIEIINEFETKSDELSIYNLLDENGDLVVTA